MLRRLSLLLILASVLGGLAAAQQDSSNRKPTAYVDTSAPTNSSVAPDTQSPVLTPRTSGESVLLPVGTAIFMKLQGAISTSSSRPGDRFTADVTKPVEVNGQTVIPVGATVHGRITRLSQPRRILGRPSIDLRPDSVVLPSGKTLPISAVVVDTGNPRRLHVNEEGRINGPGVSKGDKIEGVALTGSGAVVGTVIAGPTGTVLGAAAGATATLGHWLVKRHSLSIPAGTEIILEISNSVYDDSAPQQVAAAE